MIQQLQLKLADSRETQLNQQKKLEEIMQENSDWEQKCKKVYKDVKRDQMLYEKERYELLLKLKSVSNTVKQQKQEI